MDDLRGNENRARQEKAGVYNRMTPANADRPASRNVADNIGKEMPEGILGAPMLLDPHAQGRRSADNRVVAPGAKPRSHYTDEIRRRLANPGNPTDKYR
jgi:hypothetical protein